MNANFQSGAFSEPLLISPISAQFPNAPVGLGATSVAARSFVLGWSMIDDIRSLDVTSYKLSVTAAEVAASTQLAVLDNYTDCIGSCSRLIDALLVSLDPATT